MKKGKMGARMMRLGAIALLGLGVWAGGMTMLRAKAPVEDAPAPPMQNVDATHSRIGAGCEILQTMCFTPCEHSVSRRIQAPQEAVGMTFEETKNYYSLWQIMDFSPEKVSMRREIALYCPMHYVAMSNEAGDVVVCQNYYGDGMAVIEETNRQISDFADETRQSLVQGVPFDTREEARAWIQKAK
ncbi:MAG: hypothetical protein MR400_10725 [Clostridiales bacterium]|nr:hypothetical protein [Clostridiales bacterium]